ncbi:MAG: EF-P lysine aminoacylase GenX [Gammaproteobacteria bacterium RIFCSPHIGHO2_12_FULL_37_34]|nr:MAG: EF-P lysine aminoacylase GenX [Gammaproteobacteria bacterium RIFCSPHIGHO2_12_FULL_37_34]
MSLVQKNKPTWQPSAPLENLQTRANLLKEIRHFFAKYNVLEVETPLLCHTSVTDPHMESISVCLQHQPYYLQTSPEYAMKRLLAAGSGAIYQITKAFRQEERGHLHNPEFTILEWYRPGFNHHDLMNEMDELLQTVLHTTPAEKQTYQTLFQTYLHLDPHHTTLMELEKCAKDHGICVQASITDPDTWLSILLSQCIEPHLGKNNRPCFIYDFPASQAALARIQPGQPALASRFEVYVAGMELANGFHELQCADEQRMRFKKNLAARKSAQLAELAIDEHFLAALEHGLPDCAGVALGFDRLVMLAIKAAHIADVISFDFSRV